MFPNSPQKYEAFFREIAKNHPGILANDDNNRFTVISQSPPPFGTWDLSEFLNKTNSTTNTHSATGHKMIMCLIMMDKDTKGGNMREINGSFILLKKTLNTDKYKERIQAWDETEKACEEIAAWLKKYFEINRRLGTWMEERVNNEPVGPVKPNNMYGFICNFSYTSKLPVCVSPDLWGDFMPEEDEVDEEEEL